MLYNLTNLVKICYFNIFNGKSFKKQEIWSKILQKTRFFKFAPKRWSTENFTPNNPKMTRSGSDLQLFIGKHLFLEKKLKKRVFCKILLQIFCFF